MVFIKVKTDLLVLIQFRGNSVVALYQCCVYTVSVCVFQTDFNPFCCSALNDCDYVITFAWGREDKSDEKPV